jgi:hypothetical protein
MRVANSYFIKPNYATWKTFNSNHPSLHMLDVFSISNNMFKHVSDCGIIHQGIDHTDHTATAVDGHWQCTAMSKQVAAKEDRRRRTSRRKNNPMVAIENRQWALSGCNIVAGVLLEGLRMSYGALAVAIMSGISRNFCAVVRW